MDSHYVLGGLCPPNPLGFIALRSKAAQGEERVVECSFGFNPKARGVSYETPPCSFGRPSGAQVASQHCLILRLDLLIVDLIVRESRAEEELNKLDLQERIL